MEDRLKILIKESGLSLRDIATGISTEEGDPYLPLQRWLRGRNKSLKLSLGESLWEYFTGQKFQ